MAVCLRLGRALRWLLRWVGRLLTVRVSCSGSYSRVCHEAHHDSGNESIGLGGEALVGSAYPARALTLPQVFLYLRCSKTSSILRIHYVLAQPPSSIPRQLYVPMTSSRPFPQGLGAV